MNDEAQPPIQLISNLVVVGPTGQVLLVRYDPDDERWWLPGDDLIPYEHPDEAARRFANHLTGLSITSTRMVEVESFRGRRGWHVMFNYLVEADGQAQAAIPAEWFAPTSLPRTMHGAWERGVIERLLAARRVSVSSTSA